MQISRLERTLGLPAASLQDRAWTWGQIPHDVVGNCVSVALIKAAMHEVGNQVVKVSRTPDGYDVVMRDGYHETLPGAHIHEAARRARFIGTDGDARAYATFLYAAMAQRLADTHTHGVTSFTAALDDLGSGYDAPTAPPLLGLQNFVTPADPHALPPRHTFVCWSEGHAVFSDGSHIDVNAVPRPYTATDGRGAPLEGAISLQIPALPSERHVA